MLMMLMPYFSLIVMIVIVCLLYEAALLISWKAQSLYSMLAICTCCTKQGYNAEATRLQ